MKLTFLGTGTSQGLPYVGCSCEVCTSTDPFNKRLRCSILVEEPTTNERILVDTTPDLRQQCLQVGLTALNGVLWTHIHNDHVIGLDDLRSLTNIQGYLNCYSSAEVLEHLTNIFGYAFVQGRKHGGFPRLAPHIIQPSQQFHVAGFEVTAIPIMHGKTPIFAYRIKRNNSTLVYATDCSFIPQTSIPLMQGADLLVLDALRHEPHPTHFSVEQAIEESIALEPRRTLFTHIAHDLDHQKTSADLPDGIEIAYDGLMLEF